MACFGGGGRGVPAEHHNLLCKDSEIGPCCVSLIHSADKGRYRALVRTPQVAQCVCVRCVCACDERVRRRVTLAGRCAG